MSRIEISVLLPMYNAANYIEMAVASILAQTFPHFELLIIDDNSIDNSIQLVELFNDTRITLIRKEENTGYTDSLNYGLKIAKGEFIARMDADDISIPERFEKQVKLFRENPEIILCGGWYQILGTGRVIKLPETHEEIGIAFLEWNPIAHSAVMIRRKAVVGNHLCYDRSMEPAEDYDLWIKLYGFGKMYNMPEVLIHYRQHDEQVSIKKNDMQANSAQLIRKRLWAKLYDSVRSAIDMSVLPQFQESSWNENKINFEKYILEFQYLNRQNQIVKLFDIKKFASYCDEKQHRLIKNYFLGANSFSVKKLFDFLSLKNKYFRHFSNRDKKQIILNSLLWSFRFPSQLNRIGKS